MATPETHAMLSASSAERWINCPPSAALAAAMPESTSDYAEAGRLAHAIGELKARKYFFGMPTRSYNAQLKKLQADEHYAPEMQAATDEYLDALKEQAMGYEEPPFVALEVRVDYSDIAPGGFGTSDAVIIGGDQICVVDYKNGAGVNVEPTGNPQLMLYAYGALRTYRAFFDGIQHVRCMIVQPHAGGVKCFDTTAEALNEWAEKVVRPAAALAAEGKGEYCPGDWCDSHFCPARAKCRARAEALLRGAERMGQLPPELTDTEVSEVLGMAGALDKWIKALQDYAFNQLMAGGDIPGFKIVEGRQARDWADRAFDALIERGVDEAMLYERKPVSVAGLEKSLGKKMFGAVAEGLWNRLPGKPTLAPVSDKRPRYVPAEAAFKPIND